MFIEVQHGNICTIEVDAIVNPANSRGLMGGGVAGVIRRQGGIEIQEEAIAAAPTQIGEAFMGTAGTLPTQGVIHSPTMNRPSEPTTIENVKAATRAALQCAEDNALNSIALPGMGTGVGQVPFDDAAIAMIEEIQQFKGSFLKKVVLIDMSLGMVEAFKKVLA